MWVANKINQHIKNAQKVTDYTIFDVTYLIYVPVVQL